MFVLKVFFGLIFILLSDDGLKILKAYAPIVFRWRKKFMALAAQGLAALKKGRS